MKDRIENFEERGRIQAENVEKRKQKQIEQLAQGGSSSSSGSNVFGMRGIEARPLPMPKHSIEKIENNKRSFWKGQTISVIKEQAEIRGHRFDDLETKGEKKVHGVLHKAKKFKKDDYLEILYKLLKI